MESLITFQNDLSDRITKARVNFKKTSRERITERYVEGRLQALEQLWQDFRQGHKELLQTADSKSLKEEEYTTNDVYEQTEDHYMSHMCELKDILEIFKVKTHPSQSNVNSESVNKSSLVKLPKISIPIFSGKYTEWTTFRDLFLSLIHNNKSLDNVQRLQYLKGYLTGEAEQLIRYTPVTDANYEKCWKQLEDRYSNKKYLSHCILKRLLSQRNVTNESAGCLKELMDTSSDCLSALQSLGIDVSSWDIIVIHLLSLKLDAETRKQWELNVATNVSSDSLPTFKEFQKFLTNRYRALEFIEPKYLNKPTTFSSNSKASTSNNISYTKVLHAANVVKMRCEYCGEEHKLCYCKKFASQDFEKRHEFVTNNRMCFNCLGGNHGVRFCQKATCCRICKKKHHSLLHPQGAPNSRSGGSSGLVSSGQPAGGDGDRASGSSNAGFSHSSNENTPVVTCFSKGKLGRQVLLPTAILNVESRTGQYRSVRALLDQGSQTSFVTEATVQELGLKKTPANLTVSGVGGDQRSILSKAAVTLKIQSLTDPNFKMEIKCFVLPNITTVLPERNIEVSDWLQLKGLCLADPNFDSPNKIDILLGAEVYSKIIKDGVLKGPVGFPVAQCTALGWILSGAMGAIFHAQVDENEIIKRFWELENKYLLSTPMLTQQEQKCEEIFSAKTRRDEEGRYIVKLPFRGDEPTWKNGKSREIAIKRLKSLERRFTKDEVLKNRYTEVIDEKLQLGHMVQVPEQEVDKDQSTYLSHHPVIREDRTTTKVRVVFDASCNHKVKIKKKQRKIKH